MKQQLRKRYTSQPKAGSGHGVQKSQLGGLSSFCKNQTRADFISGARNHGCMHKTPQTKGSKIYSHVGFLQFLAS